MAENEKETQVTVAADATEKVANEAGTKKPKVKESKPKKTKANIFVRFGLRMKRFWKEYTSELKKVVWMSWKDVKKNTLLVVCAVIVFSIAIGIVDTSFGEIIEGIAGLVG